MGHFAWGWLLGLLVLAVAGKAWGGPGGELPAANEYQIKAAFLYNFANFISWPDSSFDAPDSPFVICIAGEDRFGVILDVTIRTENATAKGRPLTVVRLEKTGEAGTCHILFVSETDPARAIGILREVRHYPILTVSDQEDFIEHCGMVRFYQQAKRIRMEINASLVARVALKADANLLRLAKLAGEAECEP